MKLMGMHLDFSYEGVQLKIFLIILSSTILNVTYVEEVNRKQTKSHLTPKK